MVTNPNPLPPLADETTEPRLSREEGWELIFSLFGAAGDMYAKVGGAEALIRAERAAWGEDEAE